MFIRNRGFCSNVRVKLIGKRATVVKSSRNQFECDIFEREKYFYEKILPLFKLYARLVFNEKFHCPHYYGSRVHGNKKLLLIQYLHNHYNRNISSLKDVNTAIRTISFFHALGFCCVKYGANELTLKICDAIPRKNQVFYTVTHSDLWRNNIMYSRNEKEKHAYLIDFQFVRYDSCAKDLFYFACMNNTKDFNKLKLTYQKELSRYLKQIHIYLDFTDFDSELKIAALENWSLITKVLKTTLQGQEYEKQKHIAEQILATCLKNGSKGIEHSKNIQ